MSENRIIAVSGTPGTGKSTFARKLSETLDYKLVDLNDVIEDKGIYELDPDGTKAVDPKQLSETFKDILSKEEDGIVIDGLLSHLLSPENVSDIVILRTDPKILEERLMEREYSEKKVHENVEAEALGVILEEAVEKHGVEKVHEIDTTKQAVEETIKTFEKALAGEKTLKPGSIDWLEDYFGERGKS